MEKKENNYAFIDSQNLNLGIQEMGWQLDFIRFRRYLKEKYNVETAYIFIGYIQKYQHLYSSLKRAGFVLVFKPVLYDQKGHCKGNVDADLVLKSMIDYYKYDKAVLVTSDGDFYCLVKYFYENNKLRMVLSPNYEKCSILLRKSAREKINFFSELQNKLSYK